MSDDRTPILVGTAQFLQRHSDPREGLNPLEMLERMAREAAAAAGAGEALLRGLDTVAILNVAGWKANNPARLVAEKLGAKPATELTSELGGQIGVTMANLVAQKIIAGRTRTALIAGCNNLRTLIQAGKARVDPGWPMGGEGKPEMVGSVAPGSSELEGRYGMVMPPDVYPIFENAFRAARGLTIDAHRERMGQLFSGFTKVAAANPHAWFPVERSPVELTTPAPDNRMIAFPYTKYLNAVLNTDQAAGFFMMSVAAARELGIAEREWIYWWGGAESQEEAWWPSERPDFARCPSMLDAQRSALVNAGLEGGTDALQHFDFYSCFPIAVEVASEQLGLAIDDPRGFTVTGGLPYAGGPASAYTLHSIASMARKLRDNPGDTGLVTGNGWYLTKHAASVWSSTPHPRGKPAHGLLPAAERPSLRLETAPRQVEEGATGQAQIEAYTVLYGRDGAPARGIVLGSTAAGKRFLANTPADSTLLEGFVASEQVGAKGMLSQKDGLTIFSPA